MGSSGVMKESGRKSHENGRMEEWKETMEMKERVERNNEDLHCGRGSKEEKDLSSTGASKENMDILNDSEIHVGGTGAEPWITGTSQASIRALLSSCANVACRHLTDTCASNDLPYTNESQISPASSLEFQKHRVNALLEMSP